MSTFQQRLRNGIMRSLQLLVIIIPELMPVNTFLMDQEFTVRYIYSFVRL